MPCPCALIRRPDHLTTGLFWPPEQAAPTTNGTLGVFLHRALTLGASLSERASVCINGHVAPVSETDAEGEMFLFNETVPGERYGCCEHCWRPTHPRWARLM